VPNSFANGVIGGAALILAVWVGPGSAHAQAKKIPREHSKIDVRIDGLDHTRVRYYYAKPSPGNDYKVDRYIAYYLNRASGQYVQVNINIAVNSEYYWSYVADTTVETIKRLKYFKDKSIRITGMSSGMNAGYDSAAGEPNYLLFTADNLSCGRMRRISVFGPHGGTTEPYHIAGYYCAPQGKSLTAEQAARIAKSGLIYRAREDDLGNDLHPAPKL